MYVVIGIILIRKYDLYTVQLQALSKQDKIREHERRGAKTPLPFFLLIESFLLSPLRIKNEVDFTDNKRANH